MISLFIFLILIILSGFFSSSETAFFSLSEARARILKDTHPSAGRIVAELKKEPQKLLITILIGNNIVNLFMASYATVVATKFFDSAALGIATGATTIFILIFGEIIPKSVAYNKNETIALLTAWPLYLLKKICAPLIFLLMQINTIFTRLMKAENVANNIDEKEIRAMSRLGVEHGNIDYREHHMIENIFRFDDISVDDVMTPWYKVTTLSGTVPVDEIAHFVSHEGFSRYPVHDGKNDDNILGYVHVNDIMKALNSDKRDQELMKFINTVSAIPEHQKIDSIFRQMLRAKSHMFLVHKEDNPQEFVGLVTLEDVIEQILGEIVDENDPVEEVK